MGEGGRGREDRIAERRACGEALRQVLDELKKVTVRAKKGHCARVKSYRGAAREEIAEQGRAHTLKGLEAIHRSSIRWETKNFEQRTDLVRLRI